MFLMVVDLFCKWPEVIVMNSMTTAKTTGINELRSLFSRWGIPERLVIDNGSQFKFDEFEQFLNENGIKHMTTYCSFLSCRK